MPLDSFHEKPFTTQHLADMKLLETQLGNELCLCSKIWINLSLNKPLSPDEAAYIVQCFPTHHLFLRMKHLKEQMYEVDRLLTSAQSMDVL